MSLDGICDFFNELDITNTRNVVILAIAMCIIIGKIIKAIYSTYVEEIFMNPKSKRRNIFYKIIALLIVNIIVNFVLIVNSVYLWIAIWGVMIGLGAFVYYQLRKTLTEKYAGDIERLTQYYKDMSYDMMLITIFILMPLLALVIYKSYSYIPLINCVIMVSIAEAFLICLLTPELIKCKSQYYFINDGEKMYIYGRIDENIVLCGDNPVESESEKIMAISYGEFAKMKLIRVPNQRFSKETKKQLIRKLKENRRIAKELHKKIVKK